MKNYEKPIIEEEVVELEDVIAASSKDINTADEKNPFAGIGA